MKKLISALGLMILALGGCTSTTLPNDESPGCDSQCSADISAAVGDVPDDYALPDDDYALPDDTEDGDDSLPDDTEGGDDYDLPEPERVTFKVSSNGTSISTVTFTKGGVSIAQRTNVATPWQISVFPDEPSFAGFNMNAQLDDGNRITCAIYINGELMDRNTSYGQYSVVTCATQDPNYSI